MAKTDKDQLFQHGQTSTHSKRPNDSSIAVIPISSNLQPRLTAENRTHSQHSRDGHKRISDFSLSFESLSMPRSFSTPALNSMSMDTYLLNLVEEKSKPIIRSGSDTSVVKKVQSAEGGNVFLSHSVRDSENTGTRSDVSSRASIGSYDGVLKSLEGKEVYKDQDQSQSRAKKSSSPFFGSSLWWWNQDQSVDSGFESHWTFGPQNDQKTDEMQYDERQLIILEMLEYYAEIGDVQQCVFMARAIQSCGVLDIDQKRLREWSMNYFGK